MPEPRWARADYDPFSPPDTRLEVVGRGKDTRTTKTNIPDVVGATILQRIGNVSYDLADIQKQLHYDYGQYLIDSAARGDLTLEEQDEFADYVDVVTIEHDDGTKSTETRPQALDYEQLAQRYEAIRMWESGHQRQIENLVSVKGFSIIRTTGGDDPPRREAGREPASSAGGDQRPPRWK